MDGQWNVSCEDRENESIPESLTLCPCFAAAELRSFSAWLAMLTGSVFWYSADMIAVGEIK